MRRAEAGVAMAAGGVWVFANGLYSGRDSSSTLGMQAAGLNVCVDVCSTRELGWCARDALVLWCRQSRGRAGSGAEDGATDQVVRNPHTPAEAWLRMVGVSSAGLIGSRCVLGETAADGRGTSTAFSSVSSTTECLHSALLDAIISQPASQSASLGVSSFALNLKNITRLACGC